MRRAQGGGPTKEGTKPWVAGIPSGSPVSRDGMSFKDSVSPAPKAGRHRSHLKGLDFWSS
jgi:hypothetical protein